MYVCMFVCMHACMMSVRMCVCTTDGNMYIHMY